MHAKTEAEINSFTQVHKTIIKISMQGFKSDSNKNALNTAPIYSLKINQNFPYIRFYILQINCFIATLRWLTASDRDKELGFFT